MFCQRAGNWSRPAAPASQVRHVIASLSVRTAPARGDRAGHSPRDGRSCPEHHNLGRRAGGLGPNSAADRVVLLLLRNRLGRPLPSHSKPRAGPAQLSARCKQGNDLCHLPRIAVEQHGCPAPGRIGARGRADPGRSRGRHGCQRHDPAFGRACRGLRLHVRHFDPKRGEMPGRLRPEGLPAPGIAGCELLVVPGRPHCQDHARNQGAQANRYCTQ